MKLTFSRVIITLRLQKNIQERYFFFNLRNGLESAFRKVIGCARQNCYGCVSGNDCSFPPIFSQTITTNPLAIKRYQKPSFPFIFHPSFVPPLPNKGMAVEIEMILIGPLVEHYELLVRSISLICSDFAVLLKAESTDYYGNRYLIMDEKLYPDRLALLSVEDLLKNHRQNPDSVNIHFITPMLLLQQGRPLREFSFSSFIRALFRRVSSLAYYYGGVEIDCDFKRLAERSSEIRISRSDLAWSEWQGRGQQARIVGITGRAVFYGDIEDFYPFLLLGEYFNLGKGAAFGRGKFLIE